MRRGAMNESPLGSGALAATTLPIDREATAQRARVRAARRANSLDAVGDRDFAVELVGACALLLAHLSRLGEELVLWASQEFGFARLPEAYCSGSSIMPQKVNPDLAELVRAKVARVIGDLTTLLVVVKGLPLAYNKDLQETQEPLYDAVETALLVHAHDGGADRGDEVRGRAHARARRAGAPVRDRGRRLAGRRAACRSARRTRRRARSCAWRASAASSSASCRWRTCARRRRTSTWDESLFAVLDAGRAVDRRDVVGGPARDRVLAAIEAAERELGKE